MLAAALAILVKLVAILNLGTEEHIKKDNKFHVFKHLHSLSFKIIDKASSKYDLKIKEALHINWRKPNSDAQQNHLAVTLSL